MTDLTESKKDEQTIDAASAEQRRRGGRDGGGCARRSGGRGGDHRDGDGGGALRPPVPAAKNADDAESMDAMVEQYDEATRTLTRGELVEGRVVEVRDDEVIVYVGYKSEGRIPASELGLAEGQTPSDVLKVDDKIFVKSCVSTTMKAPSCCPSGGPTSATHGKT